MVAAGHLHIKALALASISRKEPVKSRPLTVQPNLPFFSRGKKRLGTQLERILFLVGNRTPSISPSAAVSFPLGGDFGKQFSHSQEEGVERERQSVGKKNEILLTKTLQEKKPVGRERKEDVGAFALNSIVAEKTAAGVAHASPYGIVSAAIEQDVRFIMTRSLRDEAGIALAGKLNEEVKKLQERWSSGFVREDSLSNSIATNSTQRSEYVVEDNKLVGTNMQGNRESKSDAVVTANGATHATIAEELVVLDDSSLGVETTSVPEGKTVPLVNRNSRGPALSSEMLKSANGGTTAAIEIRNSLSIILEDLRKRRQESERLWVQERDGVNTVLEGMWSELDNLQTLLRLLEEEMVVTSGVSTSEVQSTPLMLNGIGTLPLAALTYPGAVTRLESAGGSSRPGDAAAVAVPNTDARPLSGPKSPRSPRGTRTGMHASDGLHKKGSWHEWAAAAGLGAYALAGGVALFAWRAQVTAPARGSPPTPVTAVTTAHSMQTPTRPLSPLLREARPGILELNADNFYDMLYRRPTFVMFYAPWCPYCQRLEGTWKDMAVALSEQGYNVQVAQVNAWKYPQFADAFQVPGFPTLILFNGVQAIGVHRGPRDLESLLSFVDLKMV